MNWATTVTVFFGLIAGLFASGGCQQRVPRADGETTFITVVNGTQTDLTGVKLEIDWHGGRYYPFPSIGNMNPSVSAGVSVDALPIPVRARVEWVDSERTTHQQEVAVREHCAPRFKGDVIFTIRPDATVVVSFEPTSF